MMAWGRARSTTPHVKRKQGRERGQGKQDSRRTGA